jgi:hypothetical protein
MFFARIIITFILLGAGFEKNKKRDVRDWYHREEQRFEMKNNVNRRGDIPVLHGDCDGEFYSKIYDYLNSIGSHKKKFFFSTQMQKTF